MSGFWTSMYMYMMYTMYIIHTCLYTRVRVLFCFFLFLPLMLCLRRAAIIASSTSSPRSPARVMSRPASHAIFDLDGTLIDTATHLWWRNQLYKNAVQGSKYLQMTQSLVYDVCFSLWKFPERIIDDVNQILFSKFGKVWESKELHKIIGMQQLEAARVLVKDYDLPCTAEEFVELCVPLYKERWSIARPLPGAARLIKHFHEHRIPMALASNSLKANILDKLRYQPGWTGCFSVIIGGDEVKQTKPAPDIYITAAKLLGVDPGNCLVIEDSPTGVIAGKAAGMQVVAVPSLPKKDDREKYKSADCILSSLLDFKPETWGFAPFQDWVCDALPIEPWYVAGPVIKGYGRGSKVLGIPTANLPTSSFSNILSDYVCGIYLGWAGLSSRGVFKMVMSVGWNPYFDNSEKTVEPWLLHEFPEDFYGEELRLVVVGYIRPEANFPSLEALVERIHEDGCIAERALEVSPYSNYRNDPSLTIHENN